MSVTILGLAAAMALVVGVMFVMFVLARSPAKPARDEGAVAGSIIFGSDSGSSCAPGDGGSCDGGGGGD